MVNVAPTWDHQLPSQPSRNLRDFAVTAELDYLNLQSHNLYFIHTTPYQIMQWVYIGRSRVLVHLCAFQPQKHVTLTGGVVRVKVNSEEHRFELLDFPYTPPH